MCKSFGLNFSEHFGISVHLCIKNEFNVAYKWCTNFRTTIFGGGYIAIVDIGGEK
jgi:hypothetical protein